MSKEKNGWTLGRKLVYGITGLAGLIVSCGSLWTFAQNSIAKPALERHHDSLICFHQPIYDTLKKHADKLCLHDRKMRRFEAAIYAQYKDSDIPKLRQRISEIESRDSLFQ